jgi:CDP-glucose 4,6-dehydratase
VYKQNSERISFTEEAELFSKEPYGASKVAAEQVIQAYYSNLDKPKFAYAIARAGNIVGAGDDGEARLIPYLIMCASTNTTVVLRHPTATRPWTYILDIINGYWKLAKHIDRKKGYLGAWNFGTNPSGRLTVLETTNLIMQELEIPKPNVKNSPETFYEQEFLELSSLKSFRELSWRPKFSAEQAVKTAAKNHFRFVKIGNFNAVTECLEEYEIREEQSD